MRCHLGTAVVFSILVLGGSVSALWSRANSADLINGFWNLNDNQVPQGWVLCESWGNGGIENGRLEAHVVDAQRGLCTAGTIRCTSAILALAYDANLAYSTSGFVNGLRVKAGAHDFYVNSGMSEYQWGLVHRARIYVDNYVWQNPDPATTFLDADYPLEYTDYHYEATLSLGQIEWKATKISDGSVLFDNVVAVPLFDPTQVEEVAFTVYVTTESDGWIDNLSVSVTGHTPTEPVTWGAIKARYR
jgi:hypothetical protein